MAQIISLTTLLKLLSINGSDIQAIERSTIIEQIIRTHHPKYYDHCCTVNPAGVLLDAKEWGKNHDNFKVRYSNGKYHLSYHVYAGCSGDWHEKEEHSRFMFIHMIRDFKEFKY